MATVPRPDAPLSSSRLARERRTNPDTVLPKLRRETRLPLDNECNELAEVLTWKCGPFHWKGILVDPSLGDVPVEAEGAFRWLTIRRLLNERSEADQFGRRAVWEAFRCG